MQAGYAWERAAAPGCLIDNEGDETMSKTQHRPDDSQLTQNQTNQMSDDPKDGSRNSETLGGGGESFNKSPEEEAQHDQSTIEAFGQEGAGIAAKE